MIFKFILLLNILAVLFFNMYHNSFDELISHSLVQSTGAVRDTRILFMMCGVSSYRLFIYRDGCNIELGKGIKLYLNMLYKLV